MWLQEQVIHYKKPILSILDVFAALIEDAEFEWTDEDLGKLGNASNSILF